MKAKKMGNADCRCEGLGLVREMILLYTEMAKGGVSARATPEQKKEASILTDKIIAKVSKDDIFKEGHSPKLWAHFIDESIESNKRCKAGNDFDCIMALEHVRALVHGDWGIRAALICDPKFEPSNATEDNKAIWWSQYQMRGYGTPEGALKQVEDRMKLRGCDLNGK